MRIGPLGIWELLIILVVVLLIFGPRRLPEMAKGLGQSVREFRKGIRDIKNDFEDDGTSAKAERRDAKAAPQAAAASSTGPSATEDDGAAEPPSAGADADDDARRKAAGDA